MRYSIDKLAVISLGRQGENLAQTVEIDISSMISQWPDATISMLVKRKYDADPYLANITVKSGILYWPITAADTAVAGDGKFEIRATYGDVLAKSAIGTTRVTASLTGNETDVPEAMQEWVDMVLDAASDAQTSADNASSSAQEAKSAAESVLHDVKVNGTSVVADNEANIPLATTTTAGVINKVNPNYGIGMNDAGLYLNGADTSHINKRSNSNRAITPRNLDYAVKAAMGDKVGAAWTSDEQASARERIGQEKINRDRERRLTNLEYAAQGYLYRDETDGDAAFVKELPGDISPWISLDKVGASTLVWNQLIVNPTFEDSLQHWNTSRCSVTAENGVAFLTPNAGETRCSINRSGAIHAVPANHLLFLYVEVNPSIDLDAVSFYYSNHIKLYKSDIEADTWNTVFGIMSSTEKASVYYEIYSSVSADAPYSGTETIQYRNPKAFDLTAMFGAGNEPSAEEFRAMFPADTYPYSDLTLTDVNCSAVVSCGRNLLDTASYPFQSGYINSKEGTLHSGSDGVGTWMYVDTYVPCGAFRGMVLYATAGADKTGSTGGIAFYDEDKNYITGCSAGLYASGIAVPHNASFFRISVKSDCCDISTFGVYLGSLKDYIPYRQPVSYDLSAIITKYFPDGMRSTGVVHDEIDLERKVAIQRVGYLCYDGVNTPVTGCDNTYQQLSRVYNYAYGKAGAAPMSGGSCIGTVGTNQSSIDKASKVGGFFMASVVSPFIPSVAVEGMTSAEYLAAFNAVLQENPICVNYELATPIETPITEELPEDIEVETLGSLTFENIKGDDWRVKVPNQETWLVKLGGEG